MTRTMSRRHVLTGLWVAGPVGVARCMKRVRTPDISKFGFLLATLLVSLVARPQVVSAQDEWVQVLSGGNGRSARKAVTAMAIHHSHIYVASRDDDSDRWPLPQIFRATVRDDTVWSEVTPPWNPFGYVTDMVVFQDQLFVSKGFWGEIWRLGPDDLWHVVHPGWKGNSGVTALGVLRPAAGGYLLCAAREGFEIWCGSGDSDWHPLAIDPGLVGDLTIQTARLQSAGRDLYLGIGGGSAGGRRCEVWRFTPGRPDPTTGELTGEWSIVTLDCFGRSALTELPSMGLVISPPDVWVFVGTAGQVEIPVVFKTDGSRLQDASPYNLYHHLTDPLAPYPVAYASMATIGRRLYAGTRTAGVAGATKGDVIFTDDGERWGRSNAPGFGVPGNRSISALASEGPYLYAGTMNRSSGFEVWRRTPYLTEAVPFLLGDVDKMAALAAGLHKCLLLRPIDPSCSFDLSPVYAALDSIALGFARSKGDPQFQQEALGSLKQARTELNAAQSLVNLAKKEATASKALLFRSQAVTHVDKAIEIIRATLIKIQL